MITLRTLGGIDLRDSDGRQVRSVLAQPKRLALLTMLAIDGFAAPIRRDVLLALFWPDSDMERARAALRQALTFLRRELGVDLVVGHGDSDLRIDDHVLECDVTNFTRACVEQRCDEALELYRGDFASGLFIPDAAPDFDDWIERHRTELRAKALTAAKSLVAAARAKRQFTLAAQWARAALNIAPDDEDAIRSLMRLLVDAGDRTGAIRAYEAFAASLMRQLGVTPSKETRALIESIRVETTPAADAVPVDPDARKSIAVLTFVNMTGDTEHDFLCHGLSEELLMVFSKMRDLRVVPITGTFGLKGRQPDLQQIRERADVASVLDGTIWRGGSTARISVHLIDASSRAQLWAESYEREWRHVAAVQGQLARSIAEGVHVALTGERAALPQRPTSDVEAYNLYLRGRFQWVNRIAGPLRALEFLNQAVALDPDFALAHAALADAYNTAGAWETSTLPPWETVPKAQAAAIRALEIDPHLAEAHAALGYISSSFLYDWSAAEKQFSRALAINPDYQHAHHWYSHLAMALGRVDESLHFSLRALQSDPLDPIISIHLAWHYWLARQYEQVLEQADRTADLDASGGLKPIFSGLAHLEMGNASAAIDAHREGVARTNGTNVAVCMLGYSYAVGGERKLAREILKRISKEGASRGMFGYECAVIHAAFRDTDRAFDELSRAYRERSSWIPYLNVDPRLDGIRNDPRFHALLNSVGLGKLARQP